MQEMKGGKYLTEAAREAMLREQRQAVQKKRIERRNRRFWGWVGIIGGNAAILALITHELIHNTLGMIVMVILSTICGRLTK